MPTFGRTGSGKWHIVGPDGCWYGQAFAEDPDTTPDETVTVTGIVASEPPESAGGSKRHRLVPAQADRDFDTELCGPCRFRLEKQQRRRSQVIANLKRVTPLRDVEWIRTEDDSLQSCYWCRVHEATLFVSERLDCRVCQPCCRLYNSPLGEPGSATAPDTDCRPATPAEFVTPIVIGSTLPNYDPTEMVGGNRPIIEVDEGLKYAKLKFHLERTGHAFTPEAIEALRGVRDRYAETVTDDKSHQTGVEVEVNMTAHSATLEGVYPIDMSSVIEECWRVVGDPDNWYRAGWPRYGRYGRPSDPSIPGSEPVVDVFPRLQTASPDPSVDTETLQQITESGRYQRGERYYTSGAVTDIERVDDRLQAMVQGGQVYDVRVTIEDGRYIGGWCSCPDEMVPCKHIVAAVLASGDVKPVGGEQEIEEVVEGARRDELESFVLYVADEDISFRKRVYEELLESRT